MTTREKAEEVECPFCHAKPGVPCISHLEWMTKDPENHVHVSRIQEYNSCEARQRTSEVFPLTNDSHFYINVDEKGLRSFGGSEDTCRLILEVLGGGKVVTRAELAEKLREVGIKVREIDGSYWSMRKILS